MKRHFVVLAALAAIGIHTAFSQGNLAPPGAPAPTMKTLQQVEPRIEINAVNTPGDADSNFRIAQPGSYYLSANVTGVSGRHGIEIAANDVTLDLNGFALNGVAGSLGGVTVTASVTALTVSNGTVRGWGQSGIGAANARASIFEDLRVLSNGLGGLFTGDNATVVRCTARSNTGHGFAVGSGSVIAHCTASTNTDRGISAGGFGCSVSQCTANSNTGAGIFANRGSTVADCAARANGGDGIRLAGTCHAINNTANGNGTVDGAGIHVTGTECVLEGNKIALNFRGIDVDVLGNLIIRNVATGNSTNYDIVVSNKVGVIVSAPNSAVINGATGGAGVGTTDPWANLSF